jgi:hypothetical protein
MTPTPFNSLNLKRETNRSGQSNHNLSRVLGSAELEDLLAWRTQARFLFVRPQNKGGWIARGATALRAPTRKPGGGTR